MLHCYLRMNIISFRGEIMTKILDVNQTIYELCNQYPEIISIMIEIGFENITKPGMLQTAGRVMTLPKGCRMKGISLDTVKEAFQNNGFTIIKNKGEFHMSEIINNREQQQQLNKAERQELLKKIIKDLHNGRSVDEVKTQFEEAVGTITVAEISQMEQALMEEEGIPVEEVQRLCSVHTAIFKGSIDEIHRSEQPEDQPGHPIHTFKLENKEIDMLVNFKIQLHFERFEKEDQKKISISSLKI